MTHPIIYLGVEKPERHLANTFKFKAYLIPEEKQRILEDLKKHFGVGINFEDLSVDMIVNITVKEYDKPKLEKTFWYENQQNVTKNS